MKTATSKVSKCYRCLVFFYLSLNCVCVLCEAIYACYLLLFRREGLISKPKKVVLYFLIVPVIQTFLSTVVGWIAIQRQNIKLMKLCAVILAATALLEIFGCLWSFTSLPEIHDQVLLHMEESFVRVKTDLLSENWWNSIQRKLKCCGLHGPTDYHTSQSVPFSCCGSDPTDDTKGSCSFLWQKGCSSALTKEVSLDLILLSIVVLIIGFFQILGSFILWCYTKRISREANTKTVLENFHKKKTREQ